MFFSDAFDFAADGCLGKPVFGSNSAGLPLLLGVFVEYSNAVNVEAAATVDAVASKSYIYICTWKFAFTDPFNILATDKLF